MSPAVQVLVQEIEEQNCRLEIPFCYNPNHDCEFKVLHYPAGVIRNFGELWPLSRAGGIFYIQFMKDIKQELTAWKGRKVLMVIYPHPDDETMGAGGLLLTAKKLGWQTVAVILTKGGAGQMHVHPNGRTIKEMRMAELEKAASILQIDDLVVADYDDGKLRQHRSRWEKWLKQQIIKYHPAWIVTFDHSGISGHPDHISLSLALRKVSAKLYWTTLPQDLNLGNKELFKLRSAPTHILKLRGIGLKKWQAMKAHRSQKLPGRVALYRFEWYHEVEPRKKYPHKFVEFKI